MSTSTRARRRGRRRGAVGDPDNDNNLHIKKNNNILCNEKIVHHPAKGLYAIILIGLCSIICGFVLSSLAQQDPDLQFQEQQSQQQQDQLAATSSFGSDNGQPPGQQSDSTFETSTAPNTIFESSTQFQTPSTPATPPPSQVVPSTPSYESVLPLAHQRPSVIIDLKKRASTLSETIQVVSDKVNCRSEILDYYKRNAQYQSLDPKDLRRQVLEHLDVLLKQHQSAVDSIVSEAEKLSFAHVFNKSLRVNYTDVHRLRNEFDWQNQMKIWEKEADATAGNSSFAATLENIIAANPNFGISGGPAGTDRSGNVQPTSFNGGAPVLGPPEWLTPIKTIVMNVNKNFGDIPVNTSMSAVHLPLPIYPGLPEIMNVIAWSEGLDEVFRKNLANFAHVHHQYYGDHLGPLRTFPAHKWRIPRLEPDLFDARTRPWYSAGVATPKDVVILVDSSGSMTGLRREIAKGVVFEILDTLNNNDHFTVLRFSESVTPVGVPKCKLRQPRLGGDLVRSCDILSPQVLNQYASSSGPVDSYNNLAERQSQIQLDSAQAGSRQMALQYPGAAGNEKMRMHGDCDTFRRRSWNPQHAYLRDHPDFIPGINHTYITDDEYGRSIANITADIRDAYMLPATSRNIRYLKANFSLPTAGIANFTHALMASFELLNAYNLTHDHGSQCNKAIMLITDGADKEDQAVFNRYNYPGSPVRVFTYMIGREVNDIKPTKAMACNNRGYYTHVINLSEIREQVLKYLPVFARPSILAKQHPTSWTSAYGDETYQVLTDWVLEIKRRDKARLMLSEERERAALEANSTQFTNIELTNIAEYDDLPLVDEQLRDRLICEEGSAEDAASVDQSLEDELDPLGYSELACFWAHSRRADLLTSVVKPVYSKKNETITMERVLNKNNLTLEERKYFDAILLGVGAVDLRVADMIKLAPSHLLGPNAYSILIGPNGFILHHPDLRALLEDPFDKYSKILKPNFNSVDLLQVEQVHDGDQADLRVHLKKLSNLRNATSRRIFGSIDSIAVKRTIDCRRRAHVRNQSYFYAPVKDTPFSLVLSFPSEYGLHRALAKLDLDSKTGQYLEPLSALTGKQQASDEDNQGQHQNARESYWTLHPEYRYCEGGALRQFDNDSTSAIDFLVHNNGPNNNLWSNVKVSDLTGLGEPHGKDASQTIHCDKNLFPSLLFDAAATSETQLTEECPGTSSDSSMSDMGECNNWCSRGLDKQKRSSLSEIFGLELSFVATRSGLTRARLFDSTPRTRKLAEIFLKRHPRGVDEPWYSRAVDFNMRFMEDAVIISVPFNAYVRLIAKLRQRITQKQPTPTNSSRLNCDPDDAPEQQTDAAPANAQAESQSTSSLLADDPQAGPINSDQETTPGDPNASPTFNHTIVNYNDYTTFELLDLIVNSSVHVSSYQTIMVHFETKKNNPIRTPVAVSGQLYDYAHFAKSFLNKTNWLVQKLDQQQTDPANSDQATTQNDNQQEQGKVDLCPGGECPTRCGLRNDSIDCLLVDFNSFIIVSEDLVNVGRSLADYDDRLMASLVDEGVFKAVRVEDYQAICTRNDQQTSDQAAARSAALAAAAAAASQSNDAPGSPLASPSLFSTGASSMSAQIVTSLLANLASSFTLVASTLYAMLTVGTTGEWSELSQIMQLSRSAVVEAQSSPAAILATLPNKTFLRPCERTVTVYETPALAARSNQLASEKPVYYASRCKCSAWYVYAQVEKTNLIMLVVNTTNACRRQCGPPDLSNPDVAAPLPGSPLPSDQQSPSRELLFGQLNRTNEEQVCSMLERAETLQVGLNSRQHDAATCISHHPDESRILLCGSANQNAQISSLLITISILLTLILYYLDYSCSTSTIQVN